MKRPVLLSPLRLTAPFAPRATPATSWRTGMGMVTPVSVNASRLAMARYYWFARRSLIPSKRTCSLGGGGGAATSSLSLPRIEGW
jgi:hypothetical protein